MRLLTLFGPSRDPGHGCMHHMTQRQVALYQTRALSPFTRASVES